MTPHRLPQLLGFALLLAACGGKTDAPQPSSDATNSASTTTIDMNATAADPATQQYAAVTGVDLSQMQKVDSLGYYWQDITVGSGELAEIGKTISLNYTGWLPDGTEFDSSLQPGREPYNYVLGRGNVIPGWNIVPAGMRVGGTRLFVLPSELGYGMMGRPPVILPGAVMVFRVELLGVQ